MLSEEFELAAGQHGSRRDFARTLSVRAEGLILALAMCASVRLMRQCTRENCCLLATARLAVYENSNSSAIRASGIQGPDAHASKNGRERLGSRQACLVRSVKPQTGTSRSSGVEKGAHDGEGETCTHQFAQIFACFKIPRSGTFLSRLQQNGDFPVGCLSVPCAF